MINDSITTDNTITGRCWIDALEMALHCSGLLIRSMTKEAKEGMANDTTPPSHAPPSGEDKDFEACDSDYEKHFKICGLLLKSLVRIFGAK